MAVPRFPSLDCSVRAAALLFLSLIAPSPGRAEDLAALPNSWTATSALGAPSARVHHTAVWTGEKMIVWGGDAGMVSTPTLGNGALYDPPSNTWSPVATAGAPAPREFATAVWTGSEMIVWGGIRFNSMAPPTVFNNGGIYDPQTNSWRAVSTSGAPAARFAHSAVWTGSEMIVWGGDSNSFDFAAPNGLFDPRSADEADREGPAIIDPGPLNSGGIYDPSTDTWRPLSTVNAPSPRAEHTAVWTGSRMIVWGGDDAHSNIAGGGIYDPDTDSWIRTLGAGEPSARDAHTAVWTGSDMIIWGGIGLMDTVRTGGVFDPVANSWKSTNLTGSPSARGLHVAVSFRGRMIVWGGSTGNDEVNTGGIYDPDTDTWTPTSLAGAPSGREQATAVFTGAAMIVWGGFDGAHLVSSGGVYAPPAVPCVASSRGCIDVVPPPDAVSVSRP